MIKLKGFRPRPETKRYEPPTDDERKLAESERLHVFNAGRSYTVLDRRRAMITHRNGAPINVVKICNKSARRVLRKRAGETRLARRIREAQAQRAFAHKVAGNGHAAERVLNAQREHDRTERLDGREVTAPLPRSARRPGMITFKRLAIAASIADQGTAPSSCANFGKVRS